MSGLLQRHKELIASASSLTDRRALLKGLVAAGIVTPESARALMMMPMAASQAGLQTPWVTIEGDSTRASDTSGSTAIITTLGSPSWATTNNGYQQIVAFNGAVGGTNSTQCLARIPNDLANSPIGGVLDVCIGTNDWPTIVSGAVGTPGTTIDNIYKICQAYVNSGRRCIVWTILPNGGIENNAPALADVNNTRAWISGTLPGLFAAGAVTAALTYEAAHDPATNNSWKSGWSNTNDKHPSIFGNYNLGVGPLSTAYNSVFPSLSFPSRINVPTTTADVYNSVTNKTGCVNTHFMLDGAPTAASGAFSGGTQPNSWLWTTSTSTGLTPVVSVGTDPDGDNQAVLSVTGTPSASNPVLQLGGPAISAANLSPGDVLVAQCRVIIQAGAQGLCFWGAGVGGHYTFFTTPTSTFDIFWGDAFDRLLMSQPYVVPTPVPSNLKATWQVGMFSGSGANYTIGLSRFGVRKLFI